MKEKSDHWLKEELERAKVILEEAKNNYLENREDYSAKLLLLSTENYLMDLLKEHDRRNM